MAVITKKFFAVSKSLVLIKINIIGGNKNPINKKSRVKISVCAVIIMSFNADDEMKFKIEKLKFAEIALSSYFSKTIATSRSIEITIIVVH